MNLTLHEVDHILKALQSMSNHDVARARELISSGVTDHDELIQKLKDYRVALQTTDLIAGFTWICYYITTHGSQETKMTLLLMMMVCSPFLMICLNNLVGM